LLVRLVRTRLPRKRAFPAAAAQAARVPQRQPTLLMKHVKIPQPAGRFAQGWLAPGQQGAWGRFREPRKGWRRASIAGAVPHGCTQGKNRGRISNKGVKSLSFARRGAARRRARLALGCGMRLCAQTAANQQKGPREVMETQEPKLNTTTVCAIHQLVYRGYGRAENSARSCIWNVHFTFWVLRPNNSFRVGSFFRASLQKS
jgi:hypothetical protein